MDLENQLRQIVAIRESGNLSKSRDMFEHLIKDIDKSNPIYVKLMAEYVIQLRLEGKAITSNALKIGKELYLEHPNDPSAIRSFSHTLSDLGGYELTVPMFRKMIELYPNNSLKKGEEQAHLAYTLLRSGHIDEAASLINESIKNIQQNTEGENYIEVRESYAYFVKSLIENAKGDKQLAKKSAERALEIAEKGKSTFRIAQAKELLTLFNDK